MLMMIRNRPILKLKFNLVFRGFDVYFCLFNLLVFIAHCYVHILIRMSYMFIIITIMLIYFVNNSE